MAAKLIQVGGETLRPEMHEPINSVCSKEEFLRRWKKPITVPIYKLGDRTDCRNE
jgi:hypothetical protein